MADGAHESGAARPYAGSLWRNGAPIRHSCDGAIQAPGRFEHAAPADECEVDGRIEQEVIAKERLVTSLAIEEHSDTDAPSQFHQFPVAVDTRSMERFVHVPENEIELVE